MANPWHCKACGQKIDRYAYWNAVYCCGKCRKLACLLKKERKTKENGSKELEGVTGNANLLDKQGDDKK